MTRGDERSLLRDLTRTLARWRDWQPRHAIRDEYGRYARWARHTPTGQRYVFACKQSLYHGSTASFMESLVPRAMDASAYLALAVGTNPGLGDCVAFDPGLVERVGEKHRVVSKQGVEVSVWHVDASAWGVCLGDVVSRRVAVPGVGCVRERFEGQLTLD